MDLMVYVPSHLNYQPTINGAKNVFRKPVLGPREGDCARTLQYIKELCAGRSMHPDHSSEPITLEDVLLDYLQLLYTEPMQQLPVLHLKSTRRCSGRTTFLRWVDHLFAPNTTFLRESDLTGDFNSGYATRLVACLDEFALTPLARERLLSLQTATRVVLNTKGQMSMDVAFYTKFILATNQDVDRKLGPNHLLPIQLPPLADDKQDPQLLIVLMREAPMFLGYLSRRQLRTERKARQWFHPDLLELAAKHA